MNPDAAAALFDELRDATASRRGVSRESYGPGEDKAIALIDREARARGLETGSDAAANLVISLPGRASETPYVACGSHLDSVPEGGNYDGAAGVVAGLAAMCRLLEEGTAPAHNVKTIALRGEESAWYGRACIGSSALFGRLTPEDLAAPHREGEGTLGAAMARTGADIARIARGDPLVDAARISGWLELHIEQGPVLVEDNIPVAVVSGIRGNIRHRRILCLGEAGHSGAVPRRLRRDAVFATARLIAALDDRWAERLEDGDDLVVTAGIVETDGRAHAMSRIPGELAFSFEARSQNGETLEAFYAVLQDECRRIAGERNVRFAFDRRVDTPPATMDADWRARLLRHAGRLGLPARTVPCGAGHDAALFAEAGIPSAMIFVRNEHGSHNPREAMRIDDFMKGCDLLYQGLLDPPR